MIARAARFERRESLVIIDCGYSGPRHLPICRGSRFAAAVSPRFGRRREEQRQGQLRGTRFPIIWRVANGFLLIRRQANEYRTPRATEPQERSSNTK